MTEIVAPVSGRQFSLSAHGYDAVIATVGATLRVLRHHDRDLVVPFETTEVRPRFRGAILAPWPNRVVDGRYRFDGVDHQLPLTEPGRGHALHGLLAWTDFEPVQHTAESVRLTADVVAQDGYPFPIRVDVRYQLDNDGLTTTVTGTNLGQVDAPWGTGPHPYLVADDGRVDDWTLHLPAREVLEVTDDRLIPLDLAPVSAQQGRFDFTSPRLIGTTAIDHAFTSLVRSSDETATVRLTGPRTGVQLTWGPECPWVQVHTADLPAESADHRIGLAVEPMTCAPDAFNTPARGLVRLPPGGAHQSWWRIGAT